MATLDGVKTKIRNLINMANARTGGSHSDLTSAVNTLAAGYMGGESTEYYRYLTFMDVDNESVVNTVGVAPVYNSDKSVGPTLYKESTHDTVYTHTGWSRTPDGESDASVFKNITQDLTLYPVFTPSTRYYNVRFYDGGTLLKTEKVPYGGFSLYSYDKIGARFMGWDPLPYNITSDMNCYGTWEFVAFATDSWAQIADAAKRHVADRLYSVGDEKEVVLHYGDGRFDQTIAVRIVALPNSSTRRSVSNNPDYSDSRYSGMVCLATMALPDSCMEYSTIRDAEGADTYIRYGFKSSEILTYLNENVFSYLPSDLQAVIPYNTTLVYNYLMDPVHPMDDYMETKLWIPSTLEVGGKRRILYSFGSNNAYPYSTYGYFDEFTSTYMGGNTFKYFADLTDDLSGAGTDNPAESRVMRTPDGTPVSWWLRNIEFNDKVAMVHEDGSVGSAKPNTTKAYIVFGFDL